MTGKLGANVKIVFMRCKCNKPFKAYVALLMSLLQALREELVKRVADLSLENKNMQVVCLITRTLEREFFFFKHISLSK